MDDNCYILFLVSCLNVLNEKNSSLNNFIQTSTSRNSNSSKELMFNIVSRQKVGEGTLETVTTFHIMCTVSQLRFTTVMLNCIHLAMHTFFTSLNALKQCRLLNLLPSTSKSCILLFRCFFPKYKLLVSRKTMYYCILFYF